MYYVNTEFAGEQACCGENAQHNKARLHSATSIPESTYFNSYTSGATWVFMVADNENVMCALGIYNNAGAGVIRINEIRLISMAPESQAANVAAYDLERISAITSGVPVAISKLDTASADLPAQVQVYRRATVTPAGGGASVRRYSLMPLAQFPVYSGLGFALSGLMAGTNARHLGGDSGRIYRPMFTDVQGLIIREGEGFALELGTRPSGYPYGFTMQFRNVNTGATYTATDVASARTVTNMAPFAVMNNAGSGVTLELVRIDAQEIGDANPPYYTLEPIDGFTDNNGTAVPIGRMDTGASAAPSAIEIRRDAQIIQPGAKRGVLLSHAHNYIRRETFAGLAYSTSAGNYFGALEPWFRLRRNSFGASGLCLRAGEGVALVNRNFGVAGMIDCTVRFDWIPTETGSSSSVSAMSGFNQGLN